ncbi:hypothetical protein CkaCkLH20_11597 [Colletotrichum karsti]|uniref:Peptidase C45 hydrolase domain-containing protein n=1 Tax=Colletotrichum karsti TaxID=1095194 RepID=A0A9P6I2V2_9PEZI|nr:uncharacterized protein CkaCkLH20_11597 [Colletotrichum karsti]KAF9870925.1 hypothetical protein CkaCkLH20_11597 [Colletotrichum karsti]
MKTSELLLNKNIKVLSSTHVAMLEIHCSGTPYEIGRKHGLEARDRVHGSLAFYGGLFKTTCNLDWPSVCEEASKYVATLERLCPKYFGEIRGIAEGAEVGLLDVVALNVRTEINFGLFTKQPSLPIQSDGCTSLAVRTTKEGSWLAQNWDWMVEQSPNLIACHIAQDGLPKISMITEAGIIGKIGFNSAGVGVCLNAIRAYGVDHTKLPIHLALRTVLESGSKEEGIDRLTKTGVAGSGHILVADSTGGTGLECTSKGILKIPMDSQGLVVHSNHLLLEHPGVVEPPWLQDSRERVVRLRELAEKHLSEGNDVNTPELFDLFKDQKGYPGAINRHQVQDCKTQTLFNIIMHLPEKRATVTFGRPTEDGEQIQFSL